MSPIQAHRYEGRISFDRIMLLVLFVVLMMVVLVVRVGYLQISQYDRFEALAHKNRIEQVPLPSARGLIYDRNGDILAQNFEVYNLEIQPELVEDMDVLLEQLGLLVRLTEDDLTRFRALIRKRPPFERQTLRANLTEKEVSRLAVNLYRFPGTELKARLQRRYTRGELTAHVVGYVGRISVDDLERVDAETYRGREYIGKSGVEASYESILLGKSGHKLVETNAHGKVVRDLEKTLPDVGQTIHLSLDIQLQEKSMKLLEGYEGSVVALEPSTGEVLAFASVPSYDPNPFVNGIDRKTYGDLRDSGRKPLYNRALYGGYSPGSTIKGFMSLVGMQHRIDPRERVACKGFFRLPNSRRRFRDWKKSGHGIVDGHDAIEQSCNIYYYELATRLGIDNIHEGMGHFGFGQTTGIDLKGEPDGNLPSREWKRRVHDLPWTPGDTVVVGIGQGYMTITPLQLATATAILANRGRKVVPRLVRALENPQSQIRVPIRSEDIGQIEVNRKEDFDYVIQGMRDVMHGKKGTARRSGKGLRYQMAGKTGTVQVRKIGQNETYVEEETAKHHREHSLFIGFAPVDDPRIAVSVIVEHGGGGSRTAAPIARELIDFYLMERLGMFRDDAEEPDQEKNLVHIN